MFYHIAPKHLRESNDSTEYGIPYKWGGFDDIGNSSTKLANGKTAGDVRCKVGDSNYVRSSVTGIDCSGLVSRAYGFSSKLGTSTIPDYFEAIQWSQIQQGELGNKKGHVWVYISKNYDYLGRFVAYSTVESTVEGDVQGAKEWYKYPSDAEDYTPRRRK